jgi:hypothetical protein
MGLGFSLFVLFGLTLTFQAFCVQSLFSSTQTGLIVGIFTAAIQFIILLFVDNSDNSTIAQKIYTSISPHAAVAFGIK